MSDHEPSKMSGHEPTKMSGHEPTKMSDKPIKGTSEGEPLNEKDISHDRSEDRYAEIGEDDGQPPACRPLPIPASVAAGRALLNQHGVAPANMDDCLRRLLGGNLALIDIEFARPQRGAA